MVSKYGLNSYNYLLLFSTASLQYNDQEDCMLYLNILLTYGAYDIICCKSVECSTERLLRVEHISLILLQDLLLCRKNKDSLTSTYCACVSIRIGLNICRPGV